MRAIDEYNRNFIDERNTHAIFSKMLDMWPHKLSELTRISNDRQRLRAAFIRTYSEFLSPQTFEIMPKLQEEFGIRKYSVYMEQDKLIRKIYYRANVLLKNPGAYSEVLETCKEFISRGCESNTDIKNMTLFKIIGVTETMKLIAELPEAWNNEIRLKRAIWNCFRSTMIRTRHYAKQQHDWLKNQDDYYPILNSKEQLEENSEMIAKQVKNLTVEEHLKLCKQQIVP